VQGSHRQGNDIRVFTSRSPTVIVQSRCTTRTTPPRRSHDRGSDRTAELGRPTRSRICGPATTETAGTISANVPAHGTCSTGSRRPATGPTSRVHPQGVSLASRVRRRRHRAACRRQHHAHQHAKQLRPAALNRRPITGTAPDGWHGHADQRDERRTGSTPTESDGMNAEIVGVGPAGVLPADDHTATYRYGGRKCRDDNPGWPCRWCPLHRRARRAQRPDLGVDQQRLGRRREGQ